MLSARFIVPIQRMTTMDITLQIAKAMIDKKFVPLMTQALNEVDLFHPRAKTLINALLKPLECLSRLSNKLSSKKEADLALAEIDELSEAESYDDEEQYLQGMLQDADEMDDADMEDSDNEDDIHSDDSDMSDDDMLDEMGEFDELSGDDMSDDSEEDSDDDEDMGKLFMILLMLRNCCASSS
jgi:E3 ubiquitin-protein ligase HUWE1